MTLPDWWPNWTGQPGVIVASGPSAGEAKLELVRGKARVVAVNSSWQLTPWADALYGCDGAWWKYWNGVPEFSGLRITPDKRAARDFGLCLVGMNRGVPRLELDQKGVVGDGRNSGFHALNLFVQFGCNPILLVGFDMRVDDPSKPHWNGKHPAGLNNPRAANMGQWCRHLNRAAKELAALGVSVINCNPDSALTGFPKMPFMDAIAALERA